MGVNPHLLPARWLRPGGRLGCMSSEVAADSGDASDDGVVVACQLLDLGLAIRRERHRREHPDATDEEVEAILRIWMLDRPGAPFGDAIGRPIAWPRTP